MSEEHVSAHAFNSEDDAPSLMLREKTVYLSSNILTSSAVPAIPSQQPLLEDFRSLRHPAFGCAYGFEASRRVGHYGHFGGFALS